MNYKELIDKMTLEEKASLMSGENFWNTKAVERLNIPAIMLTDGPHGLRKQGGKADHLGLNKSLPATCFPTAATLANSWDRSLLFEVGEAIGKEAASEKVSVLLGPGLNIKRNPLCGRNFEYFSEDPFLSGELASDMVNGIQSQGISACPKHYAVNSQEHMRMTIDEIVDERALREIYLEGFRKVIEKSRPKTVMSSYNKVNGVFANENQHLMNDILYDEWNFEGVVVTDWGGNNDRIKGLKAGNQLEMPATNGITDREIVTAVETGDLKEELLDQAVDHLLKLVFETAFDSNQPEVTVDYEEQHQKAIDAAKRSLVLLKNEAKILPLKITERVAIIGDFAETPRYQGAGSSLINPYKISSPRAILEEKLNVVGFAKGFKRMGGKSQGLLKEAIALAKTADKVLLFLGLDEGSEAEGVDRTDLKLRENQLLLISELSQITSNIIVILAGGGAIEMPFINHAKGIVHTYLAGQGSAEALAAVLLGEYNPSGKLNETFPLKYEDVSSAPYFPGKEATSEHRESLFIGYRYFDTVDQKVLFPFGFGLSYTDFTYSDLVVEGLSVRFKVTNSGEVAGEEIAQLYVQKKDSKIFRAKRELKGFEKIHLEPGATQEIVIQLNEQDFAYYNTQIKDWSVEPGAYEIQVGSSLLTIYLQKEIQVAGSKFSGSNDKEEFPNYYTGNIKTIPDQEFYRLLGYKPPSLLWDRTADLGMNDTIAQAQYKNWLGRSTYRFVLFFNKLFNKMNKPLTANNVYFILNMPFRQIERFTGGKISQKMVTRFLNRINK